MILVGHAIQFTGPLAETFEICIQLGAILAVVVLYPHRFKALFNLSSPEGRAIPALSGESGKGFTGITALLKLAMACAPAFVLGALTHKAIKAKLFFPGPVAAALIVGGIIMIIVEHRKPGVTVQAIEELSFKTALLIGLFQCAALWPGVSRSGSMIVGGLLLGLDRTVAAEFSFLVAVPIMAAATALDLFKSYSEISGDFLPTLATGFVVAFITAIVGIKALVGLLSRFSLVPFAIYRIILGAAVLLLLSPNT